MTFSDVISDIKKMIGIELHSVRPGAEITIQEVDEERDCLILKSTQGQIRSRPLSELRLIWTEMMKKPAVHVDGVLHGSGTSRNQPETILANLPYVEWLRVNNKKHIAFVGRASHAYGTLKKMDSIKATEVSEKLSEIISQNVTRMVLVASDLAMQTEKIQSSIPGAVSTIEAGVYSYQGTGIEILLISSTKTTLPEGCYTVIEAHINPSIPIVEICDESYYVVNAGGIKALIRA